MEATLPSRRTARVDADKDLEPQIQIWKVQITNLRIPSDPVGYYLIGGKNGARQLGESLLACLGRIMPCDGRHVNMVFLLQKSSDRKCQEVTF